MQSKEASPPRPSEQQATRNIVILGSGYAGLRVAHLFMKHVMTPLQLSSTSPSDCGSTTNPGRDHYNNDPGERNSKSKRGAEADKKKTSREEGRGKSTIPNVAKSKQKTPQKAGGKNSSQAQEQEESTAPPPPPPPTYRLILIDQSTHFWWRISSPRAMVCTRQMPHEQTFVRIKDTFAKYRYRDCVEVVQGGVVSVGGGGDGDGDGGSSSGSSNERRGDGTLEQNGRDNKDGKGDNADTDTATDTLNHRYIIIQPTNSSPSSSSTLPPRKIPYHALVLATGTRTPTPLTSLHGDHATTTRALDWMNERLRDARHIVIGGAGPVGVEVAGEVGELLNGRRRRGFGCRFGGWGEGVKRRFGGGRSRAHGGGESGRKGQKESGTPDDKGMTSVEEGSKESGRNRKEKVKITLVNSQKSLIPSLRPSLGRKLEKQLAEVGVDVIHGTRVDRVELMEQEHGEQQKEKEKGNGKEKGNDDWKRDDRPWEHVVSTGINSFTATSTTTTSARDINDLNTNTDTARPATTQNRVKVHLSTHSPLHADIYIPATGAQPNTSFLSPTHLSETGHVLTDPRSLRVRSLGPRVYVAGDCGHHTWGGGRVDGGDGNAAGGVSGGGSAAGGVSSGTTHRVHGGTAAAGRKPQGGVVRAKSAATVVVRNLAHDLGVSPGGTRRAWRMYSPTERGARRRRRFEKVTYGGGVSAAKGGRGGGGGDGGAGAVGADADAGSDDGSDDGGLLMAGANDWLRPPSGVDGRAERPNTAGQAHSQREATGTGSSRMGKKEATAPASTRKEQNETKGWQEADMLVPVGTGGGVGAFRGWKVPGWVVRRVKGRRYLLERIGGWVG
ncbi:MAG: hypothetical protein M1831_007503 [Alyxoria varia]|nr:MAG: hypothetical protein M1831_007503 [Alyxoria varia]